VYVDGSETRGAIGAQVQVSQILTHHYFHRLTIIDDGRRYLLPSPIQLIISFIDQPSLMMAEGICFLSPI
jgi:hypothetical protein